MAKDGFKQGPGPVLFYRALAANCVQKPYEFQWFLIALIEKPMNSCGF